MEEYKILTDPDHHDLENKKGEFYITDDLFFRTPLGVGIVPKMYVANGASIPWIAQCVIPKSGKYNRPSIVHDMGYEDGGLYFCFGITEVDEFVHDEATFVKMTQKEVDYLYLKLMESRDVKEWVRNTQYRTLRMFGWWTWNKYRKLDAKEC